MSPSGTGASAKGKPKPSKQDPREGASGSSSQQLIRSNKLKDLLAKVLSGSQGITPGNARLFLEAICDQPDPQGSILRLIASEHGFPALQSALQIEPSTAFLNGAVTSLLQYLQAPAIKNICAGDVLRQIVSKFIDPPVLWNAFLETVRKEDVTEEGLDAFSWLLLQLVSLPIDDARTYANVIQEIRIQKVLLGSPKVEVRSRTYRIIHIAETIRAPGPGDADGPGGRHDNDFADIRRIRILPTPDELACHEPFLRRAVDLEDIRDYDLALHVDNHFRLLREDLSREVRDEIKAALSPRSRGPKSLVVDNIAVDGVLCDAKSPWSLQLSCTHDLPQLARFDQVQRREFLEANPRFLRHQSVACLVAEGEIVGLATVVRNEDLLVQNTPIICLKLTETAMETTLPRMRAAKITRLIQLGTAVYSYEPVLNQLKEVKELALEEEILHWKPSKALPRLPYQLARELNQALAQLEKDHSTDLQSVLDLPDTTRLDESQARCFLAGLRQRLSLIQGPPGTGKSFIGSLIAKAMHKFSSQTILVVCYTHHALDQFLEDLIDSGIPEHDIVRLGATVKATPRAARLSIQRLSTKDGAKSDHWQRMKRLKEELKVVGQKLEMAFDSFREAVVSKDDLMEYLEFQMDGPDYADAFRMPDVEIRNMRLGRRGKTMNEHYLLDRWFRGKDAGIHKSSAERYHWDVWGMRSQDRLDAYDSWKTDILKDRISTMRETGLKYNALLQHVDAIVMEKDRSIIQGKRIIGCTTTAAAKYVKLVQSISPGVLLVEEAGEILESHILTALGPETKQMVLIGDHKQLRPKVHWDLSVEKGDGFDLNRSLFERLVMQGYPHQTLRQQHRMRPEISALARELTYPDLVDAPKTMTRPDLRGFQDNLVFVNHTVSEDEQVDAGGWGTSSLSKSNKFEATMTLRCVRYLGQQSYRTDNIVVLTPYLGQLSLLRDELGKETDPVLNDLDHHDMVRAGLMPAASGEVNKPPIRISTIDNYQGEESDIVIVSLTRSNVRQNIGFMSSPERLNVMLSRARNALIMIGDAETFIGAWKGKELWERFIELLKAQNHVYDGFPVKCERHPERKAILSSPEDFDGHCPDGGCPEPCGIPLSCGDHVCPQRCHQAVDHSRMPCEHIYEMICSQGHERTWKCHENLAGICPVCASQDVEQHRKLQKQIERQVESDAQRAEHDAVIAKLDQDLQDIEKRAADRQANEEQARALKEKKREVRKARKQLQEAPALLSRAKPDTSPSGSGGDTPDTPMSNALDDQEDSQLAFDDGGAAHESPAADARKDWQLRGFDASSNKALDDLMNMTGLDDVKSKILYIKKRVETLRSQELGLQQEQLGLIMAGNPGTGMQRVARCYADMLGAMGVMPGRRLAGATAPFLQDAGVAGAQKVLNNILKAGGGVFFLNEIHGLVHPSLQKETELLEFLLDQIRVQAGKVVFVLAGFKHGIGSFLANNPRLSACFTHRLNFEDYTDSELLSLLADSIQRRLKGSANVEGGVRGHFMQLAIRRLSLGRGREGFENAVAADHLGTRILGRQAARIARARTKGQNPDKFLLAREDIIGPEPQFATRWSPAWKQLQSLVGQQVVKSFMNDFVARAQQFHDRGVDGDFTDQVSMNRLLLGPPGSNMIRIGKLYSAILVDMGLLPKHEVIITSPEYLIKKSSPESAQHTRAILRSCRGKTLIIKDAHALCSYGDDLWNMMRYRKAAVAGTIATELRTIPEYDQCVLLLGSAEGMQTVLDSQPELAAVFPFESAVLVDECNDDELEERLNLQLLRGGARATEDAREVALMVLDRSRNSPNYGSKSSILKLISQAKLCAYKRGEARVGADQSSGPLLLPQDFDSDFRPGQKGPGSVQPDTRLRETGQDPPSSAGGRRRPKPEPKNFDITFDHALLKTASHPKLFADLVGCEALVRKFEGYSYLAMTVRDTDTNPQDRIPFCFVFKGPPGAGKATVSRRLAQSFNDSKLLPSREVIEFSVAELLGETTEKVRSNIEAAVTESVGKVLYIKEAHQMADARRGLTALSTLTDLVSSRTMAGKLVVILSGSTNAINKLLSRCPFVSRKFTEEIAFNAMTPEECAAVMHRQIRGAGIQVRYLKGAPTPTKILDRFKELAKLPSWANGRDVKDLASAIIKATFNSSESLASLLAVSEVDVLAAMDEFYKDKCEEKKAEHARKAPTKPEDGWVDVEIRVNDVDETTPAEPKSSEEPEEPGTASHEIAQKASSSGELLSSGVAKPEQPSATQSLHVGRGESASPVSHPEEQEASSERADEVECLIHGLEEMKLT